MTYCWYFSREDLEIKTPSREDGITFALESRYRKDGARFIINASNTLGLRYDTVATGVVFFHRFFMVQSFRHFDRWVVASACLLLAGKVEETPKKCKDILKVTRSLLNDQQMAQFGTVPKEQLLTHERILLQTIKFDLRVEHPYAYLLKFAKGLKGDKSKVEKIVQMAWTFINDSLVTTLCLQWEPKSIAVAFIYLAGKLSKYDLQSATHSKSRNWWRQFVDTVDIHDLETICHQVLDIYGEAEQKEKANGAEGRSQQWDYAPQQQQLSTTSAPQMPLQALMATTQYQYSPVMPNLYQSHPQATPLPPPTAPPTQSTSTMAVASLQHQLQQRPSIVPKTQSSYFPAAGPTTYTLPNPLQAASVPPTNLSQFTAHLAQPSQQLTRTALAYGQAPLAYSTLNVSVANAPQPRVGMAGGITQAAYGSSALRNVPTPITGFKSLLPATSSTSLGTVRGLASYQMLTQQSRALAGLATFQQQQQPSQQPTAGALLGGVALATFQQQQQPSQQPTAGALLGGVAHHQNSFLTGQSQVGTLGPPPAKRQALDPTVQAASAAAASFRAGVLPQTLLPQAGSTAGGMASLLQTPPPSVRPLLTPSTNTPLDLASRLAQNFSMTQVPLYLATQSLTPTLSTHTQLRAQIPVTPGIRPLTTLTTPGQLLGQPRPPRAQQQPPQGYSSLAQGGTGTWGRR